MKTVYFIRHGQSEGNASLLYQQTGETLLTAHGVQQAKKVAAQMRRLPLEALVSSTFARAEATAREIARETGLPIEQSELFIERRRPGVQLVKRKLHPSWLWTQVMLSLFSRFAWYRHSDEETPTDILERAHTALAYLAERPESTLAVVTHGRFMRALYAVMTLGDGVTARTYLRLARPLRMRNTALMVATYKNGMWEVQAWNGDAASICADAMG